MNHLLVSVLFSSITCQLWAENAVDRCKRVAPSLSCDDLSRDDHKTIARLCAVDKISKECGNHKCEKGKTDLNCPSDCRDGKDFTFETLKSASANSRTWCPRTQGFFEPRTIEEVQSIVQLAKSQGQKIRTVGASHSDNEQICSEGFLIASRNLDKIYRLETFEGHEVVHAQAGVTLAEIGLWLHERRKTLGYGIVGYDAVTIGGVLGTGAHGSSPRHSAILSDQVASLRLVSADGSIKEFSQGTTGKTDPDLWRAMQVHLGMFGVIVDVRLRVQDDFHLLVTTQSFPDRDIFDPEKGLMPYVEDCDTASINWFPARRRYGAHPAREGRIIVHCGKSIHKDSRETWEDFSRKADPGAQYALHAPQIGDFSLKLVHDILHASVCNPKAACRLERIRRAQLQANPPYARFSKVTKRLVSDSKGIRGWSHKMQNSNGSDVGDYFRQTDWEVAVPASNSAEIFSELARIMGDSETHAGPCLPLIGVYIRFSRAGSSMISHAAVGGDFKDNEPVMFLEIPEFLPSFDVKTARDQEIADAIFHKYEAPNRLFVTTLIEKFSGRVHLAKNRIEFLGRANNYVKPSTLEQFDRFYEQVRKIDPEGIFSNEFSARLF